jgi:hypothetical protein
VSGEGETQLRVYPTPWSFEWDEYAGYDCMTGGYRVRDARGVSLAVFDAGNSDTGRQGAEVLAAFVVTAANRLGWPT